MKRGEFARIEPDDTFTLHIYRAPNGQWSGAVIDSAGLVWGDIGGCESPQDVEQKAPRHRHLPGPYRS
jgi:hypothetical protein